MTKSSVARASRQNSQDKNFEKFIENLIHSETTTLTLSVNHKEPKHISYGYEIFETTKVK